MEAAQLKTIETADGESAELEFKALFDPSAVRSWCELVKDIVAIANSGGGMIVFGVNDDGTASSSELEAIRTIDPATFVDKVWKYTGNHYAGCALSDQTRLGHAVVVICVAPVPLPMIFTAPGTYDVGGGKQRTAFAQGTVYFRHGAKSEPGTSEDLREALEREINRIRSSWLDGIARVVTAPVGATVGVLGGEVHLTGTENATGVRLVNDETAPAFKAFRTDLLYPFRQKELVARINALLGTPTISSHDVYSVRKAHDIDSQPNFFYKPQYSSPQYSQAFAEWMVGRYRADRNFFIHAREAAKKPAAS